jgi:protein-export membrane protein SecD
MSNAGLLELNRSNAVTKSWCWSYFMMIYLLLSSRRWSARIRTFCLLLIFAHVVSFSPVIVLSQQSAPQKLSLSQIEGLVSHGVPDSTMADQIQRRGVAFAVTSAVLDALQRKGAGPQTLAAIQAMAPVNGAPIPGSLGTLRNANGSSPSGGSRQASGLQHCVRLILQVEVKETVNAESDNTIVRLQRDLKTANISFSQVFKPDWSSRPELVEVDGIAPNNLSFVRAVLNQKYSTQYDINSTGQGTFKLTMRPLVEKALNEKTLQQAIEAIRRRLDVLGVNEPLIQEYNLGANQILLEMQGITDLDHVKRIIQSRARLAIHAIKGDPSGYPDEQSALAAIGGLLPPDEELLHGPGAGTVSESDRVFILQRVAIIASSDFRSAEPGGNQTTGHPMVNFTLTDESGDRFYDFTSANIGKSMAVVMGGRAREVTVIKSAIRCCGEIEGAFTQEEVMDLSKLLRTGELPASLDYIEERIGCPSSSLGPTR